MKPSRNTDKGTRQRRAHKPSGFTLRDSTSRLGILKILRRQLAEDNNYSELPFLRVLFAFREKSLSSMHFNIAATN